MKLPPVAEKSVLVTGCSSGIGLACARVLRDAGWRVVPTARAQKDLDRLRADGFEPVRLDVADAASVEACAAETLRLLGGAIGGIVNNAGFGQAGAIEDLSREVLRYQFEVNLIGMQDLTNRFVPVLRRQGWGRIVNISSVLGRISMPFNGAYSATKFAMEAIADAMRVELWGSGVGVILVEPGPIVSEFRHNAAARAGATLDTEKAQFAAVYKKEIERRIRQQKKPDLFTKPPEAVAAKVRHALESERPKHRYCVTIPAYAGYWLGRLAPHALVDALMAGRRRAP
jgi:NAD(P)-dependent dehydrogenase (short-subunit alcohol dehydrogenase family)